MKKADRQYKVMWMTSTVETVNQSEWTALDHFIMHAIG